MKPVSNDVPEAKFVLKYLDEPSTEEILFQIIERSNMPFHQLKSFAKSIFGND